MLQLLESTLYLWQNTIGDNIGKSCEVSLPRVQVLSRLVLEQSANSRFFTAYCWVLELCSKLSSQCECFLRPCLVFLGFWRLLLLWCFFSSFTSCLRPPWLLDRFLLVCSSSLVSPVSHLYTHSPVFLFVPWQVACRVTSVRVLVHFSPVFLSFCLVFGFHLFLDLYFWIPCSAFSSWIREFHWSYFVFWWKKR